MPRPPNCRRVAGVPGVTVFKPASVRACGLEWVTLTVDEFEALRLADLEGLYQEAAAEQMHVSRATFGRIVESARRKVARALSEGLALAITGGNIHVCPGRRCRHGRAWQRVGRPTAPPPAELNGTVGRGANRRPERSGMQYSDNTRVDERSTKCQEETGPDRPEWAR